MCICSPAPPEHPTQDYTGNEYSKETRVNIVSWVMFSILRYMVCVLGTGIRWHSPSCREVQNGNVSLTCRSLRLPLLILVRGNSQLLVSTVHAQFQPLLLYCNIYPFWFQAVILLLAQTPVLCFNLIHHAKRSLQDLVILFRNLLDFFSFSSENSVTK